MISYAQLKGHLFREIPGSRLASTYILTKFLVYAEMPIEMGISFLTTFVCVGETARTGTTLQIV
jgi:hypothetical protein